VYRSMRLGRLQEDPSRAAVRTKRMLSKPVPNPLSTGGRGGSARVGVRSRARRYCSRPPRPQGLFSPEATRLSGLKLLVSQTLSYSCMRP
jgi:hypothetical protein